MTSSGSIHSCLTCSTCRLCLSPTIAFTGGLIDLILTIVIAKTTGHLSMLWLPSLQASRLLMSFLITSYQLILEFHINLGVARKL